MPDTSGPWDGAPWAEADWYRTMAYNAASGVHQSGTWPTTATSGPLAWSSTGLTITPAAGNATVGGAGYVRTAALSSVTTSANTHASFSRRDRLVLRRSLATHTVTLAVVVGTPAATPVVPSVTRDATTWDLPLFNFLVPPASGTALSGVVDERPFIDPYQRGPVFFGPGGLYSVYQGTSTRLPADWGSATSYPTSPMVAIGDICYRTDLGPSWMRYNGGAWRQVEPVEASIATRDAISTSNIHVGFRVRDTSTDTEYRWNGSVWVAVTAPNAWVRATATGSDYFYALTTSPTTLTGQQFNVTVPAGRTLDVEFRAGLVHAIQGWGHFQLWVNGAVADAASVGGPDVWGNVLMTGSIVGTGASVQVGAVGQLQTNGTGSSADVRPSPNSPNGVSFRYRIV